jgi:hypothetical protein
LEKTWFCAACSETHESVPFTLCISRPASWTSEAAQHPQSELLEEQCVIGGERFFLHALILLPVTDAAEDLQWRVWVEVAEDDFLSRCARWFIQGRETDPPVSAQLAVGLPGYDDSTLGVPGALQDRAVGIRPIFTVSAAGHPLSRDQQRGITTERVIEFARASH